MQPLVSIIIPTFNCANLIGETLDSVLAQTHKNWECIIVDDGSTDNTTEVVNEYLSRDNRFVNLNRPKHKKKGPSVCRNIGVYKALGEYIIFLDSDDLLLDRCLYDRLKFSRQFPKYDYWIFRMASFNLENKNQSYLYGVIPEGNIYNETIKLFKQGYHPFVITCPFWKRSALIGLNGFDESLTLLTDPDLHLRALKAGLSFKYSEKKEPDCFYRLTNRHNKVQKYFLKMRFIFLKKHFEVNDKDYIISLKKDFNEIIFKSGSLKYYSLFSLFAIRNNIVPIRNVLLGYLIMFYNLLGLTNVQKLGYYTLKKYFNVNL
jgi:glycosyltransferase involved in cell wall biosynthesis